MRTPSRHRPLSSLCTRLTSRTSAFSHQGAKVLRSRYIQKSIDTQAIQDVHDHQSIPKAPRVSLGAILLYTHR
ncbi:hypothetical protein P692DRAFT_20908324 [Suillus brevipes Sb2]|nr:hypothetical protein P692DRAFT_20908324 [Suillus brevipes Sb2]